MKASIYCRVSTEDQAERQTIRAQLDACRSHCERMGWAVAEEFLDDGVSGGVPLEDRPAGRKLMEALAERRADAVVLYCLDRLSRDRDTGIPAYNRLMKLTKGQVHFVLQAFDDTPEGSLQFTIFMGIADYERNVIRRRTMSGVAKKVRDGEMYRASIAPYGYRYSKETRQLTVREDQAAVVRQVYTMYLNGAGTRRIASWLNEQGVPTPASQSNTKRTNTLGWHSSRIRELLVKPLYKGEGVYRPRDPNRLTNGDRDEIGMVAPPIVDEGTWEHVQHLMLSRGIDGPRAKRDFMLSGRIFCWHCKAQYKAFTDRRGKTEKVRYRCSRRANYSTLLSVREQHEGVKHDWDAESVEGMVQRFLGEWLENPQVLAPHVAIKLEAKRQDAKRAAANLDEVKKHLADLEAQESRILDLMERGVYEADQGTERLKKVRGELATARRQVKSEQRKAAGIEDVVAHLLDMRDRAIEAFRKGEGLTAEMPETYAEWRELFRYLVDRVYVDGSEGNLRLKFDGVLLIPSNEQAAGAPDFVVLPDSPHR